MRVRVIAVTWPVCHFVCLSQSNSESYTSCSSGNSTPAVDIEGTTEEGTGDAAAVVVVRCKCFFYGNSKHARQRCLAKDAVCRRCYETFCQSSLQVQC